MYEKWRGTDGFECDEVVNVINSIVNMCWVIVRTSLRLVDPESPSFDLVADWPTDGAFGSDISYGITCVVRIWSSLVPFANRNIT